MRINDLKNCLTKTLLFKSFDEGVSVMEFVASRSGKPRCSFLLHQFDLTQSPVVLVSTNVQRSVRLKLGHLVLGMKAVPLGMTRHIMGGVDAAG